MITISFSTVGYNAVFLYFNHICKIEFFDNGFIEVSPDNGITWYQLIDQPGFPGSDNCVYYGNGLYNSQFNRFQEASYVFWLPGQVVTPINSWWKKEGFDISPILMNKPNAKLRFSLTDGNNNGGAFRAGWFIDNILITDSLDLNLSPLNNRITGTAFVAINTNQIKDAGEPPVAGQLIGTTSSNWITNTTSTDAYYLDLPDSGTITISPNPNFYSGT